MVLGKRARYRRALWWLAINFRACHLEYELTIVGFMTFAPEWLSGNPNLDSSNIMYLWVYLVFFNTLWVWFPFWILYEAFNNITLAFAMANGPKGEKNKKLA